MQHLVKTDEQIALMRHAGQILQQAQKAIKAKIMPGASLLELDAIAEEVIVSAGAIPAFKNFPGEKAPFPGTLCMMLNSEVVHGIPDSRTLKHGDLLSVDCGVIWKGWNADAAFSLVVGGAEADPGREKFQTTVYAALMAGCKAARAGNTLGDVGHAIQSIIEPAGYSICKEYTGHGLGQDLHEAPNVFNYGRPGKGEKLIDGMTLAIEPIIARGKPGNHTLKDGWTVVTNDGKDACQWEHFGVVTPNGLDIFA